MGIKFEIIDPKPDDKGEWIKARCANGHIFGDGKNVDFTKPCECGAEIVGFNERRIIPLADYKVIYGSTGKD